MQRVKSAGFNAKTERKKFDKIRVISNRDFVFSIALNVMANERYGVLKWKKEWVKIGQRGFEAAYGSPRLQKALSIGE